jgi:hypothetical protein
MLNEILGAAARYNQLLTRKFGLTGGAPSPQLTPEIAPVYAIPHLPEDSLPSGVILAGGYIASPATAVKQSVVQLGNPTGSNLLVVVEFIEGVILAATSTLRLGIVQNAALAVLPAAGGVTYRDTRTRTNGGAYTRLPTAQLTADASPPTIVVQNLLYAYVTAAGLPMTYEQPLVLAPGWAVQIVNETVNATLLGMFSWREVPMAHGEVGPF